MTNDFKRTVPIKFRGVDIETGEYRYGCLVIHGPFEGKPGIIDSEDYTAQSNPTAFLNRLITTPTVAKCTRATICIRIIPKTIFTRNIRRYFGVRHWRRTVVFTQSER